MAEAKGFQRLSKPAQILIVAAACGGLLAAVWYQYLAPMEEDIAAKTTQLADLRAQIARSQQQLKIFEQFKKETEELQVRLESLKRILPLAKETAQLLRQAQQAASSSSLRILRVVPKNVVEHDVYSEWPIEMEVTGTYHNMGTFLDKIRQLPRIVNINNLKLASRASEGDKAFTSSIGVTYTATTFVYREEGIASTAPPPTTVR